MDKDKKESVVNITGRLDQFVLISLVFRKMQRLRKCRPWFCYETHSKSVSIFSSCGLCNVVMALL